MVLCSATGCKPIKSERDVYGHYVLESRAATITLDVTAEHSYFETIAYSNDGSQSQSGKWQWRDGRVCFDAFLEPKQLLKDLFDNVPQQNQPKTVGRAYEIDDCLPASWEYGKTLLEVNPDSPENFVKLNDGGRVSVP
jgi:hypothetical protein